MKKIFSAFLIGFSIFTFSACRSSETSQSGVNKNDSDVLNQPNQNAEIEDFSKMKRSRGNLKESSPDAAGAPYDLQFLDTMVEHHQKEIELAKAAADKTENAELKSFAEKFTTDHENDIKQMQNWRAEWFAGKPAALNMEMPGMLESLEGVNMRKMEVSGGKQLDLRFAAMMEHYLEGASAMTKDALDKGEHKEIKDFAARLNKSQKAQIERLKSWQNARSE